MCSAPSLTAFATVLGPCALRFARADARSFGRFGWRAPHRASDTFRLAAERHIIEFVMRKPGQRAYLNISNFINSETLYEFI